MSNTNHKLFSLKFHVFFKSTFEKNYNLTKKIKFYLCNPQMSSIIALNR